MGRHSLRGLFSFPNPVNEISARLVAATVAVICVTAIAGSLPWLAIPLAYGFIARAATGPSLSPLGQLVTRVVTPRLHLRPRYVPGPPKRFAQSIGAALTTAAVLALVAGAPQVTYILLGMVAVAASLESILAFCIGCKIFELLMRVGAIPHTVCLECQQISLRAHTGR